MLKWKPVEIDAKIGARNFPREAKTSKMAETREVVIA